MVGGKDHSTMLVRWKDRVSVAAVVVGGWIVGGLVNTMSVVVDIAAVHLWLRKGS